MSKRKGDYITVEDLINEVGKDSTRFMMLNRSNEVELDFDFEKVTEKSKDNPVFYVQYAYARINSIFRTLNLDLKSSIKLKDDRFITNLVGLAKSDMNLKIRDAAIKTLKSTYSVII